MRILSRLAALAVCLSAAQHAQAGVLVVSKSPSTSVDVGRFDVFELTLTHADPGYANPFWDIEVLAVFTSPGGVEFEVGGFYYDDDTWKLRFSPNVEGTWTYDLLMRLVGTHDKYLSSGSFACIASNLHGRPRVHPEVPTRLISGDGTPFNALGTNIFAYQHPFLTPNPITTPTFAQRWDEYFGTYATYGCNTFRRVLGNESPPFPGSTDTVSHLLLWWGDTGQDEYSIERCQTFDEMCAKALSHDIGLICVLYDKPHEEFFHESPLSSILSGPGGLYDLSNPTETELHEKYMTYIVNRYAPYVHTWQLFNEYTGWSSQLDLPWQEHMAAHIRAADPYDRFVCNSDVGTAPTAAYQDMRAPHMYASEQDSIAMARSIDELVRQEAALHSADGLPSTFDEFGAGHCVPNVNPDAWRIAIWAAYFCDTGIAFWDDEEHCPDVGYCQCNHGNNNAYLDDDVRDLFLIRELYERRFAQDMLRVTPTTNDSANLRAFGLENASLQRYAAYVHNYQDHSAVNTGKTVTIQLPGGRHLVEWIDPKTGALVSGPTLITSNGLSKTLSIPAFVQDIAMVFWKDSNANIVTTTLPAASHGTPYYAFVEAIGRTPFLWSVASGSLPPGMQLDALSGQISGAPSATGNYAFTVQVVDANAWVDTQALQIAATGP